MNIPHTRTLVSALVGATALLASAPASAKDTSFKADILPILTDNCHECHTPPDGEGFKQSGLDLTTYAGVMKGTKYGPIIVPGSGSNSNLLRLIEHQASSQIGMPHNRPPIDKKLRNVIRHWINEGAKDN